MITNAELHTLLATAIPGARLTTTRVLGDRTVLLEFADRRVLVLRLPAPPDPQSGDLLAAEALALQALRAEIDLPLPEVVEYAPERYVLLRALEGTPLPEIAAQLSEEQRYDLGSELGALLARVHAYTAPAYGPLSPAQLVQPSRRDPMVQPSRRDGSTALAPPDDADVRYAHARLSQAITVALEAGEIEAAGAENLRAWIAGNLTSTGQPACLVHGDLRPERVLVRRTNRGWAVAGLVGWGFAQAWRPGWDHVALLEHFAGPVYFSLRVGYGNAYEAAVERAADQLREFALLPYRLALYLEAGRADLALGLVE
jgi:aminoglycoside phosphotransferase (APT) family kinase protein